MKKINIIKICLISIIVIITLSITVLADEKDFEYIETTDGTVTLTQYNGDEKEVIIPMYIDGKKVVRISKSTFGGNTKIKSVDIPESVSIIDTSAFNSCINLEKVNVYGDINSFGNYVFKDCRDLVNVNFYGSLCSFGKETFYNCENLEFLICPKDLKYIGEGCFYLCSKLETVVLNSELEIIDIFAFRGTNILLLDLPDSVKDVNPSFTSKYITASSYVISLYWPPMLMEKWDRNPTESDLIYTNIGKEEQQIDFDKLYMAAFNYICELGYYSDDIEMRKVTENSLGIRVYCKTSPEEMYYVCVNQDDEGNPDIIYTRKIDIFEYKKGDVNRDQLIDAKDALEILKYSADLIELTYENIRIGDFDSNGKATTRDALTLLKYVAGLSESL